MDGTIRKCALVEEKIVTVTVCGLVSSFNAAFYLLWGWQLSLAKGTHYHEGLSTCKRPSDHKLYSLRQKVKIKPPSLQMRASDRKLANTAIMAELSHRPPWPLPTRMDRKHTLRHCFL